MSLAERLGLKSFQLTGAAFPLLGGPELHAAGCEYEEGLRALPAQVRGRYPQVQAEILREAADWLRRYDRSVSRRLAGYLALGRRCHFEYPWPVVAMLGIFAVQGGIARNQVLALWGRLGARAGVATLARISDLSEDILRRTNHGIFADSVPTVLYALSAHALRLRGEAELADALLSGPLPPLFDEESREIMRGLCHGLAVPDPAARFRLLADHTLRHFAREQAIFTHQMGPGRGRPTPPWSWLFRARSVPAPVVVSGKAGRRTEFRPFPLPADFDLRDHDARVLHFGQAFVLSVTGTREDYQAAVEYVQRRLGTRLG